MINTPVSSVNLQAHLVKFKLPVLCDIIDNNALSYRLVTGHQM